MSECIRQATASDASAMHRVRMSVLENRLVSRVLSEEDYVAAITGTGRGWVAEQAGRVVAFAVGNGEDGSVWALFVEPGFEGKGLGRRLHDVMVGWLWERGHDRLWLTTEPGTRAERFYRAAGWQEVGASAGGEVRFELTKRSQVLHHVMLQTSWDRCWGSMSAEGDGRALLKRLVDAYNEPHRKYHTEQHLRECLQLFSRHWALAAEPAEVEIALWFHDAIYNVRAADNEVRSAEWAACELRQAGVSEQRVSRVMQHILATRHSALPDGQDQMLLIDIDLSILGADRPRFEEYEQQVREEYGWVPSFIYRRKRREVLSEFLRRTPLYNTLVLRAALEEQARSNLIYSLEQLRGR